jgi:AI-2 transport protein TqsA
MATSPDATHLFTRSMTNQPAGIPPGLRFLLSAACVVIVVAGLRGASTILVPLALALFVAVVSLPLLNLVRARGVPTGLAILMVVLFDAAALFLFGWLVSLAAFEVRDQLPQYLMRIQELEASATEALTLRGVEVHASPFGDLLLPERLFSIISVVLRGATDIITTVFLVTLIFVFMLAEAPRFPRKLRVLAGRRSEELGRSTKIVGEIQHYLAIKTLISIVTGLTIGVVTWGLGLDFPLLWGLLAFVLNYIPNVGSIIAAIPAVIVALLQIGPGMALVTAAVFMGVNALFGSFLEPMLVGRQLGISTIVVILSLVFWGWLWGPVGMFLSVPLTMGLKIVLENSDEFRWVAYLMTAERRGETALEPVATPVPPPSTTGPRKTGTRV